MNDKNALLRWSVFITKRPGLNRELPAGYESLAWVPNSSTLIYGERDAVLVGRRGTVHESRRVSILWPGNLQLFTNGPHCSFLDFAMAWDAGDLVQGRIKPNTMGSTLAIQNATILAQVAFQLREF